MVLRRAEGHSGDRGMIGFAEAGTTRSMDWVERLLSQDGVATVDMQTIRRLERIWLRQIRFITLESGRIVSIPDIFRRCGWWSE